MPYRARPSEPPPRRSFARSSRAKLYDFGFAIFVATMALLALFVLAIFVAL